LTRYEDPAYVLPKRLEPNPCALIAGRHATEGDST
jgi:hypothetical protein